MNEFFAAKAVHDGDCLCIGPLSRSEAPEAVDAGLGDGTGLYVYFVPPGNPALTPTVLAKVANQEAAATLARLLGLEASSR